MSIVKDKYRDPTVPEVRAVLNARRSKRYTAKGIVVSVLATVSYLVSLTVVWLAPWLVVKALGSLLAGALIATLFVAAHDACHGALTPSGWLNRLIGRILFLPTWHPFAAWEHTHNGLHHGYTNIRGLDPVFPPLDFEQYMALSMTCRWCERAMRSPVGVVLLYVWKVWLPFEAFPGKQVGLRGSKARWFEFDRACCVVFAAVHCATAWVIAETTGQSPWVLVLLSVILPSMVFFYLLAWAVHLHHTNPSVPWYASKTEWSYFSGQVRCSVHMEFPRPVELFILNIMDHTAHHADPKIPLYELHDAQKRIEAAYPTEIIHEPFTIRGWVRLFRVCRLFDYENHRWLDWDGTPLTPSLLQDSSKSFVEDTFITPVADPSVSTATPAHASFRIS